MTQTQRNQCIVTAMMLLAILIIDQAIKVWVKTHLAIGEAIIFADWCQLRFIENNGMAFGMEILPKWTLTTFRIAAVAALLWYIVRQVKQGIGWGMLLCLVSVTAGAAGNIFDCLFYGKIFSTSTPYEVARLVPWGEGYGTLLNGRVVDMFYFPLVEWNWPAWMPLWGGEHFIFFSPIFNFADACISCSFVVLFLFYRKKLMQ